MSRIRVLVWTSFAALQLSLHAPPVAAQQPQIYVGKPSSSRPQQRKSINPLAQCLANPADRGSCQAVAAAHGRGGFEAGDIGTAAFATCSKRQGVCLEVGTLILDSRKAENRATNNPNTNQRLSVVDFRILFDHDANNLKTSENIKLIELAKAIDDPLNQMARFAVIGNTDARGSNDYNCGLSARRAISVRNRLAELGVSPHRLLAIAAGKFLLRYPDNGTASENRRVGFARMSPASRHLIGRMIQLCPSTH